MKYKHYPHDDQMEAHKAREREKQRLELIAIANNKAQQELIKSKERLLKILHNENRR